MIPTRALVLRRLAPACLALGLLPACAAAPPHRHLLIVVDGLRPDSVTEAVMPTLTGLGRRGVVFARHHSVYPTVTRVNAASISTGAYPETHGLLGNSVYVPRVDPSRFLDTADRAALVKVAAAEGSLLTAPTLSQSLEAAGQRLLVVSSGSAGSAFLLNHTISGGAILHGQFALPETLGASLEAIGPPPGDAAPPGARDDYVVDAFLKVGLPRLDPRVTILWLGELDATAHDNGIGAPATVDILRRVDASIKRLEDGLRAAGLYDSSNIWVTSDHGFSTYTGAPDVAAALKPFARTLPDGTPHLVSGGGAIYLRGGDDELPAIVTALQGTPGVGAIFTRAAQAGSLDGRVKGTLSFEAGRWTHDRSAQILHSPDWTDAANAFGMAGTSASTGTAGHGSTSPWDMHNTLIAAGPDLKRGLTLQSPSANVDFGPTFLRLLALPIPSSMQGRVLEEALAGRPDLDGSAIRTSTHTAASENGTYAVTATFSTVSSGGREYRYFDQARVVRTSTR
jgi:predicted AlkP superfamily pyrophosphatase or phosphodiesterase